MDNEIKEYYKLKEKYEKTIKRQKEKIIGNEHYSVNQKKKRNLKKMVVLKQI